MLLKTEWWDRKGNVLFTLADCSTGLKLFGIHRIIMTITGTAQKNLKGKKSDFKNNAGNPKTCVVLITIQRSSQNASPVDRSEMSFID